MGYAFISYSSKNTEDAKALNSALINRGIKTWMAPGDIPAGSKYADVITKAIKGAECLVILLTDDALNSIWVDKEVERALSYRKPVIPVALGELELNDSFELYIGNQQIVPIKQISDRDDAFLKIIDQIIYLTNMASDGESGAAKESFQYIPKHNLAKVSTKTETKKNCEVIVFSPVNVDVYLEDKKHIVLRVDNNSGFDYERNNITVGKTFSLIFSGKSFEKIIEFERPDNCKMKYRLGAILSKDEIESSYDRDGAVRQIKKDATGYSFEQIAVVGEKEDIVLLHEWLLKKSVSASSEDSHSNYLIAKCAVALGKLCIKFDSFDYAAEIPKVFERYKAKKSYGYLFESIIMTLSAAIKEE